VTELDYQAFDADNHYYEALDAFTRHLDPKLGPRVVQWAEVDGRRYHLIGGRISRVVVNPTFDPVSPAGAMSEYFRGNPSGKLPRDFLREREPIRPEYRDRVERLRVMDAQGLEKIWLFPTLGMIYEELLKHDPEGVALMFRAFNRWVEEDWGFAFEDRIFAAPYISLADVEFAVTELEWALDKGARTVVIRPAAPTTVRGQRPPADPMFDPFWARVDEAGITVVVHASDSGYSTNGYAREDFVAKFDGSIKPSIRLLLLERAIYDFLASVLFDKLFDRFPNLRLASVENGAEFLPDMFKKLASISRKMPGYFSEDPIETLRRHVWINPFFEDDLDETVGFMGADRVIFGSDWPHIEGLPRPLDYAVELKNLDEADQRRVLRDNALELTSLSPAASR
jgi:predicted TIM-barrel fold metal-dependent hydrolase